MYVSGMERGKVYIGIYDRISSRGVDFKKREEFEEEPHDKKVTKCPTIPNLES